MEVMNSDLFSQTETLIGQAGKTRAMGVSDDPMLMSMLSTGFYANPLRTMIQEVMFNAWDAHRMVDLLEIPIDIYINDTTGLIVRDYGPGISDDDMVPVYCIYGASTKRKDKRQTGGFGLGCKSPFSYTESFTVTSHHEGVKSMYLVNRVSDDAEGKPGLTPLMSVPTKDTGLLVTIPLEIGDQEKAYKYIKDVLYLSGIKARIHYHLKNGEYLPEVITSKEVRPAEYVMDDRQNNHEKKIYAVYGGVRYEIVDKEEYTNEYDFMNMISNIQSLYIGFAPDTLTPLPNREGLNMSSKTKENIRVGLELCMERFQQVFEPLVHAYFRQRFKIYMENNIQAHYALYHALGTSRASDTDFLRTFEKQMKDFVPLNSDKAVWEIALRLFSTRMKTIIGVVTEKKWISIIAKQFINFYPNDSQLVFNLLKEDSNTVLHDGYQRCDYVQLMIANWIQPGQMKRLYEFERKMAAEFVDDNTISKPKLRVLNDGKYVEVVRHKNAGKRERRVLSHAERKMNGGKDLIPITPTRIYEDPSKIWFANDSQEVNQMFLSGKVILAKTVTALNDTPCNSEKYFFKDYHNRNDLRLSEFLVNNSGIIPAYVVHSRKGGYDKAKEILENLGFTVIEGTEPAKYVNKSNKPRAIIPQYRRLNTAMTNWQDEEIDIDSEDYDAFEDGIPLTNPTHFLYVTASNVNEYEYRSSGTSTKPSKSIVKECLKLYPDIAMVTNMTQAQALVVKGIKPLEEIIPKYYGNLSKSVYGFRNLVRVLKIKQESNIPFEMMKSPVIQKALGIVKIDKDNTQFWDDIYSITLIMEENYLPLRDARIKVIKEVDKIWALDPMKIKIKGYIKEASVFSESSLNRVWFDLSIEDREEYEKKIARFIRAV